jgi:hypothetical protein
VAVDCAASTGPGDVDVESTVEGHVLPDTRTLPSRPTTGISGTCSEVGTASPAAATKFGDDGESNRICFV